MFLATCPLRKPISHGVGTALLLAFAAGACADTRPETPTASSSRDPVVGRYTLTVTAGSTCTQFPEIVRRRTYTANIASRGADNYVATLSDALFLTDQ